MERDLPGTDTEELVAKINDELVEMTKIDDRNFEGGSLCHHDFNFW